MNKFQLNHITPSLELFIVVSYVCWSFNVFSFQHAAVERVIFGFFGGKKKTQKNAKQCHFEWLEIYVQFRRKETRKGKQTNRQKCAHTQNDPKIMFATNKPNMQIFHDESSFVVLNDAKSEKEGENEREWVRLGWT